MDKPTRAPYRHPGSAASYTVGFVLSLLLTLLPYFVVTDKVLDGWALTFYLIAFALAQLYVQLFFFLHLGRETRPRWNLLAFIFMILIVTILVFGTLWIMGNLNYQVMSPREVETYIQYEEGIRRE